ncbi:cell cycle control protein 50A-like isoform X2, partial [Dinothrombium tinctorium]
LLFKARDALRRQRLPAWEPILTPTAVLSSILLIGFALIVIGIMLLITIEQVNEKVIDYTNCVSSVNIRENCSTVIARNIYEPCWCIQRFSLDEDFGADAFFYYRLSHYHQNLRRYINSKDSKQLLGYDHRKKVSKKCEPFEKNFDPLQGQVLPIAPCGAIANSLFNDTFKLYFIENMSLIPVEIIETDISWPTDKKHLYINPPNMNFEGFTKPPYWRKYVFELDLNNSDNNGYQNEHFIVWMRTSAFPTFRKLWGRIDHKNRFSRSLPKGNYVLQINYSEILV